MINWREKFRAFAIHFLATAALGACAAALIFLVWFPHPFATMIGGTELFMLVVGCDMALGPLISLVIYNSRKSRRELITDYTLVALVQLAAMIYGVYIVAGTRPVYVAFNKDRLEVVTARDISAKELGAARDPRYAKLPYDGLHYIFIKVPAAEQQEALFESVGGNEEHDRPKFYAPYESGVAEIRAKAKPLAELTKEFPASAALFADATKELQVPAERVRWLPVRHRLGFWTALLDAENGKPLRYVKFDPYGGS